MEPYLDKDMVISKECKDKHIQVFNKLRFPLNQTTKEDMLRDAKNRGFKNILKMTFSCWYPIDGYIPCRRSNMCKERII